jgi:FtsP/CotA-like multicopper oxidase with cupredoxin domain
VGRGDAGAAGAGGDAADPGRQQAPVLQPLPGPEDPHAHRARGAAQLPPRPAGEHDLGLRRQVPGPTIDARYGQPLLLRVANALPSLATHKGFGIPQTVTHLHNFHTASESDGGPWDWVNPGAHKDHHYTMARAGFSVPDTIPAEFRDASGGDVRETLTTLFLHEHRPEFTAANVYKGLVSMVRLFDEKDTGDETNAAGWRLPSGPHDVPLVLADKLFNPSTGQLTFDSFETDGHLGDKVTVNGKIQPFFTVKRRKYRFRVLNGSQARFFNLVLRSAAPTSRSP